MSLGFGLALHERGAAGTGGAAEGRQRVLEGLRRQECISEFGIRVRVSVRVRIRIRVGHVDHLIARRIASCDSSMVRIRELHCDQDDAAMIQDGVRV